MNSFRNHWYVLLRDCVNMIKSLVIWFLIGITFAQSHLILFISLSIIVLITVLCYQILKWYLETYEFVEDSIIARKGVFSKKVINIPLSLIQTADIVSPFWQRKFHVCELSIDTGTMQDEDGIVLWLKEEEAENLRQYVLGSSMINQEVKEDEHNVEEEKDNIEEKVTSYLYEISPRELLIYSLSRSSILMTIVIVISISCVLGEDFFTVIDFIMALPLLGFLGVVVAAAMVLKLRAVIQTYIGFKDYKIERDGEILKVTRGMFNKKTYSVNLSRICGIYNTQNIIQQHFNMISVNIVALGYGDNEDPEPTLIPLITQEAFESLQDELFPAFKCHGTDTSVSKKSRQSYARKPLILGVLTLIFSPKLPITLTTLLLTCTAIYAFHCYRMYKYANLAFDENIIAVREGGLTITKSYIMQSHVDSLTYSSNYFQRKKQLSTFKLVYQARGSKDACKGRGFSDIEIQKLERTIENY